MFAVKAEIEKNKHSKIFFFFFLAFYLIPIMGGIFMLAMQSSETMLKASMFKSKVEAMNVSADWDSLFMILLQAMGIGGIIIFGFIVTWLFGREYTEHTVKDLLSLPTSRTNILNAKYILYFIWSITLAIFNLLFGMAIGIGLQLPGFENVKFIVYLQEYFITTFLTVLLGTPLAFFSMLGRGYLAPLGVVALTVAFSQIIAALGYGHYFPWAVPALFSGTAGEYKEQLNLLSYIILFIISVFGYCITVFYWKYTDHNK
jgi:ABC-2 type transport system permease protein